MSSLTFTIIQTDLHWEDKAANLKMLEEKINNIDQKTEIVILPEMFSTGFSMKPEQLAEGMDGEAVAWMMWMLPNGQMGLYDKRHLFAYAKEHQHYTAGTKRLIASVKGWKINLLVCYDLRFPVWSRQTFNPANEKQGLEYDVLIYVANWPERRSHMWRTLLQARAIENQCYCIGVNRIGNDGNGIYHSGDSMVVNPLGEVLYHKAHEEDVYTVTLQKEELLSIRDKMPFWKDADPFLIIQD